MLGLFSGIKNGISKAFSSISEIQSDNFEDDFADQMTFSMYHKILSEAAERMFVPDEINRENVRLTLYDSYSPYKEGLLRRIVWCIVHQKRIYLKKIGIQDEGGWFVFESAEQSQVLGKDGRAMSADYVELDFTKFNEVKNVKVLFKIMRRLMNLLSKGVKVSSTLLLKINKLSEMVNNPAEMQALEVQLKQINDGLSAVNGNGAYVDAGSEVGFTAYDSTPLDNAISTIYGILSNITGVSRSVIAGEVVTGLGSGDNGDEDRNNMAFKRYFYSVLFGVFYSVYLEKFGYQDPADVEKIQAVLDLISTSDILTDEAKIKFAVANSPFSKDDFDFSVPSTPRVNEFPTAQQRNQFDQSNSGNIDDE